MNKFGQQFVEKGLVFLGLWLISSIIWSFWLDGIEVAVVSCLTAIGVTSVINITISGKR